MLRDINVWFKFEKAEIHAVRYLPESAFYTERWVRNRGISFGRMWENVETRKTKGMMEAHKD